MITVFAYEVYGHICLADPSPRTLPTYLSQPASVTPAAAAGAFGLGAMAFAAVALVRSWFEQPTQSLQPMSMQEAPKWSMAMSGSGSGAGKKIRIATRKSPLAMWQAEFIESELKRLHPGIEIELQPMSTRGDKVCAPCVQTTSWLRLLAYLLDFLTCTCTCMLVFH